MSDNLNNWLKEKKASIKISLKKDDWFEVQIQTTGKSVITYGQGFYNTEFVDEKIKECVDKFNEWETEPNITFPVLRQKYVIADQLSNYKKSTTATKK